jgi:hypothetical protein
LNNNTVLLVPESGVEREEDSRMDQSESDGSQLGWDSSWGLRIAGDKRRMEFAVGEARRFAA